MEKGWPKRPSNHQLQEAHKKTLIEPQLLQWRQSVSLHNRCHQSAHKPSSLSHLYAQLLLGRAATSKNSLASRHVGSLRYCLTLQPCRLWSSRILCQGSPGKETGAYWPILVVISFQSTILPIALAANPPEYLVLPETL